MTSDELDDDIEIISSDDDKVKLVGEILSNDSSRKILKTISNGNEMTAKEISQTMNMSLTLVAHHLRRMHSAGMVKIAKTGRSIKGQNMKYYVATEQSFLITPPEKTTDSVFESLKKFSKFVAIGMAGLVSWLIVKPDDATDMPITTPENEQESTNGNFVGDQNLDASPTSSPPEPEPPQVTEPEPEPEPKPEPEPEPAPEPTHSGVEEFTDADTVSLDRSVYPEPWSASGGESIEPLIFSILVPVLVVGAGIVLERLLSRWHSRRKLKKLVS